MQPPVEIKDRAEYKRRINELLKIDHHWMALELMSRSIAWVLTVDEFKSKVQAARVPDAVSA